MLNASRVDRAVKSIIVTKNITFRYQFFVVYGYITGIDVIIVHQFSAVLWARRSERTSGGCVSNADQTGPNPMDQGSNDCNFGRSRAWINSACEITITIVMSIYLTSLKRSCHGCSIHHRSGFDSFEDFAVTRGSRSEATTMQ